MPPSILIYATAWCPFCRRAKQLLEEKGQRYEEIDLDRERDRRAEMVERTGRTSVPQIFIGERHIGGYDELAALERSGELDSLLAGA
jgi:glutaredoxin 3